MKKEKFGERVKEGLLKRIGDNISIKVQMVKKNNGVEYLGMLIQKADSNISPTVYLDNFYECYQQGEKLDSIVERILYLYREGEVKAPIDMEFFREFTKVKERIAYRLINAEQNKELLEQIPHIIFMDLAICFYYAFQHEQLGEGMILIYNSHMKMWNTNHQELMKLAQENTPKLFPTLIITMDMILQNMSQVEADRMEPLYVLTNQQRCQGAACILYSEMLENIAKKLGGSYYILPSSIHEVILLRDKGTEDAKELHEVILEANSTQLLKEEILSDYPYYYNCSEKKLTQIREK